ncbi:MAG: hypothetical protein MUC77_12575 [Chromatiaceae bacterium]|nr:hypothetical protein [Chromatiaceae bacterium]
MADNEHIERLLILTRDLERELAGRAHDLDRHARGSAALVRALVLIMGVLALANLWFVYDLTQEIRQVIAGMDEMRGHFGRVSARMADIQARTAAMEQDVGLMPVVGAQMQQIGGDLDHMRAAVASMRGTTGAMDVRMDDLNRDLADMTVRFRSLNRSVGAMGADVDQMARPVP